MLNIHIFHFQFFVCSGKCKCFTHDLHRTVVDVINAAGSRLLSQDEMSLQSAPIIVVYSCMPMCACRFSASMANYLSFLDGTLVMCICMGHIMIHEFKAVHGNPCGIETF